jgi:selenocysteine lyase/cysteine desulfurase
MGLDNEWTFLNHAATSPLTKAAAETMRRYADDLCRSATANRSQWEVGIRQVRHLAAQLLHCSPGEIAFVKNTSEGISLVANGLNLSRTANIVTTDIEYPSNIYPWMRLSAEGVSLRPVPNRNGRVPADDLFAAVDQRTKVIALSSVEFSTGFRHDLRRIGEFCRQKGIFFFVDGIQSVGGLDIDVKQCGISALCAGAQKWLLGPVGAGFLFVDETWLPEVEPTEVGWFTVENAEEYLDYRLDPKKDAGKFECGSLNVVGILGMGASMKILLDYGLANVEKRVMQITDCLCEGLKRRGYDVYSSRRNGEKSGIVLFASQSYPAEDVWRRLLDARIITSLRYGRVRVSPHFYNTDGDIEKLMGTLP